MGIVFRKSHYAWNVHISGKLFETRVRIPISGLWIDALKPQTMGSFERQWLKVRTIFTKCLRALLHAFLMFLNLRRLLNIFTKCSLIIRVKAKQITPLLWCQIFPNKFRLLQNMNLIASLWKMSACRCDYIIQCGNLRD